MQVGLIGLGNMGKPMAGNVLQAGFDLTVHDLRQDVAKDLLAKGAKWAESPVVLAEQVDVLLLSLPGPPQVETVVLGEKGILAGKDLHLIHELGRQTAVPLELAGLVEQIFRRAQTQYGGDQGELHVVKLLEDATGVSLQPGDEAT